MLKILISLPSIDWEVLKEINIFDQMSVSINDTAKGWINVNLIPGIETDTGPSTTESSKTQDSFCFTWKK